MKTWYKWLRFNYHRIMSEYYMQQAQVYAESGKIKWYREYVYLSSDHATQGILFAKNLDIDWMPWSRYNPF